MARCNEAEEWKKAWGRMCVLCVFLMAALTITGVLALQWREELGRTRRALDNATQQLIKLELEGPALPPGQHLAGEVPRPPGPEPEPGVVAGPQRVAHREVLGQKGGVSCAGDRGSGGAADA